MIERSEEAVSLSESLLAEGIYAPAVRPPTVKRPRLRITVTAAHTEEDIKFLAEKLREHVS
jgi:7-keto-8-aminopelargonate synthetase-like enzyme